MGSISFNDLYNFLILESEKYPDAQFTRQLTYWDKGDCSPSGIVKVAVVYLSEIRDSW